MEGKKTLKNARFKIKRKKKREKYEKKIRKINTKNEYIENKPKMTHKKTGDK